MGEWITTIAGTPEGRLLALILALTSAIAHAVFGALQKGRHDPWLTRGAIDIFYGLIALPIALFAFPNPTAEIWWLLGGAWVIHTIYKLLMAMAYTRGAYTVVYPVVRGTGPLITVIFAWVVFGELLPAHNGLAFCCCLGVFFCSRSGICVKSQSGARP